MSQLGSSDAAYVIATGAAAVRRLELLTEVFAPGTTQFLARLLPARSFLDVGCGLASVASQVRASGTERVIAADINPEVIDAARARTGIECVVASVDDLGNGSLTGFDIVYARCLLSHLSDPAAALGRMMSAARPGGIVAVEDVQVSRVWSAPDLPELNRYSDLYVRAALARGACPELAPLLPGLMREVGLVDVETNVLQPILSTARARTIHGATMHAIGPAVVEAGLCEQEEVDELTAALIHEASSEAWEVTLPLVVQVSGQIPS